MLKSGAKTEDVIIKLADKVVRIEANFPYIKEYCEEYLADGGIIIEDFCVKITEEDIAYERRKSIETDEKEGHAVRRYSDAYLESLAVYRKIAEQMIEYDTLLFHGSAIAVDGEGYLFTAKSGVGKSTHARIWRAYLGERAVVINDDKPLLQITDDGVFVCGTPWDGKHRLSSNQKVPLRAIGIIERSADNHVTKLSARQIFPVLLQQSYRSQDAYKMKKTLGLLEKMTNQVAFYKISCNMQAEAARIAYEIMSCT